MRRLNVIILSVIILLAIILRFFQLGNNPPSLDWDEASLGYNAYSILKTGSDEYGNFLPLSIRSFDDYKPPLYVYLTVPSVFFFGLTEFAVRFPSAVVGVIGILGLYFLVKELLKEWDSKKREYIALTAAFFMAISPWHLQFSRAAFEGNIGLSFLILGFLFFFKGLKKEWFFIISALSFVLSLYSYHSFRLIIPLFLIVLGILFFKELRKNIKMVVVSAVILGILALPIYLSFITPGGTGSRLSMVSSFGGNTEDDNLKRLSYDKNHNDIFGQIFHNRRLTAVDTTLEAYLDHFNPEFLFIRGDGGVQHHAAGMGMLYIFDIPFILAGIFFLLRDGNKRIAAFLILFLLAAVPASITSGTPHPVRAITMLVGFHVFAAVGIVTFFLYLWKIKKPLLAIAVAGIVCLILLFQILYYLHQYYVHTPIEYGYFWQYGNKDIIQYAKEYESEVNKIIITYEYDQPYIYYLFYNKIDPAWYQKNWDYNKNGQVDRFKRIIGNYEFRNIQFESDSQLPNVLLIGSPKEIPQGSNVLKEVFFPDGRVAYRIIKT